MSNRNMETYNNYANSLSSTISKVLDTNEVNTLKNKVNSILETVPEDVRADSEDTEERQEAYMAYFDSLYTDNDFMTAFDNTRTLLRDIVEANSKFVVDCAYISYVFRYTDSSGVKQGLFVYLVDSAPDEDACPPGWLDPVYSMNKKVIDDPARGFPAYTTNTSYGYLVTSGAVIENTDYAYACVDISMNTVRATQANSIIRLFVYLIVTIVLLAVIGVVIVYFTFARPLNRINQVAKSFNNTDPKLSHDRFEKLKVKTHDELSELSDSIKTMENGVVERFNELIDMNHALISAEEETAKMTALANKDSLTGVQSKTAYDTQAEMLNEKIKNKEQPEFGLVMVDLNYLKEINDQYGHSAGDFVLIKLANMISLVFKKSSVYRVGGDEFVVILYEDDLHNAEKLVEEFKERINDSIHNESIPPQERVSAAIGYAVFNPFEDKDVEQVFNNADHKMYECKRKRKKAKKAAEAAAAELSLSAETV